MSIPQPSLEVQLFAQQLAALLGGAEAEVLAVLRPTIQQLMAALDALAARPEPLSPEQLEAELYRLTIPLNDQMERLLGAAMVALQEPLREQARRAGPLRPSAPFSDAATLLRRAEVEGESIAEHLRRRSPSRWQASLMGSIRAGLEAGWARHRAATEQAINRLANVMAETALWAHGNSQLELNWAPPEQWLYVGVLDPATCPICSPWIGRTAARRNQLPATPQHWRCRCHAIPQMEMEQ